MRTFIAIQLPEEIKEVLEELSGRLRKSGARANWVNPANVHLTLRFLGEISPEQVERIADLLAEGYSGTARFEVRVAGVGAFPNSHRPAVIWAGVGPLEGGLGRVQAVAEQAACAIGLAPEKRPFHPHLTLARIKDPQQGKRLIPYLEREESSYGGAFIVSGVSLFSSTLRPQGPLYQCLREFALT